jgi:hypothetical protein
MSQERPSIATSRLKLHRKKTPQTFSLYHILSKEYCNGFVSDCKRPHMTTALMAQGKTMAEHDETQQEKELRWTAQRAAHDRQQQEYQAARTRRIGRSWLIVGAIAIIIAVIATAILL